VRFVGRIISGGKIEVDRERLQGLLEAQPPKDKDVLRSYLSTVNWLNSFIPHLAAIGAPMWELPKKDKDFYWSEACMKAFEAVKFALTHTEWLEHLDPEALLILRSDACMWGIAVALLQKHADGSIGALAFFSRKLTPAEQRYPTIEQEALSIVWGLQKVRGFVEQKVLVLTDHSNLQWMHNSENLRVGRWLAVILMFEVSIVYMPGRTNFLADYMCRALEPSLEEKSALVHVLIATGRFRDYLEDDDVKAIREAVADAGRHVGADGAISLEKALPTDIVDKIFIACHNSPITGHMGAERTLRRVRSVVQWPGVDAEIRRRCSTCPLCQKLRARDVRPVELAEIPARGPMEGWLTDLRTVAERKVHPRDHGPVLAFRDVAAGRGRDSRNSGKESAPGDRNVGHSAVLHHV